MCNIKFFQKEIVSEWKKKLETFLEKLQFSYHLNIIFYI